LWVIFHFTQANEEKTPVKTPDRILGLLKENPGMTLAEVAGAIGRKWDRLLFPFLELARLCLKPVPGGEGPA